MPKEKIKKRTGGRPPGTSKYKENTVPIRIPLTLVPYVEELLDNYVCDGFEVMVVNERGRIYSIVKKDA